MGSNVYFIDMRADFRENFVKKLERLMFTAGIEKKISKKDLVAVKLHFGEIGNVAFIRPVYVRRMVQVIRRIGGIPFLTDANTLYVGTRSDAPNHLATAVQNGFAQSVVEAPLIIADGLRGKSEVEILINRKRFKSVYIAKEIVEADSIVSISHFKCHELSGFGGTIKNLGMGCASRRGKLAQHSSLAPKIVNKKCKCCEVCLKSCSMEAIIKSSSGVVKIDSEKCVGCGGCIIVCPNSAIQIRWNRSVPVFLENMIEYTEGVLVGKLNKSIFFNFIMNVSPACDCHPSNDAPIVKDIGVLCSDDPVAIDQASVDLVNNEPALSGTCLRDNIGIGDDKFKEIYPEVDWQIQLDYAQILGLGSRNYKLVKL